MDDLLIRDGLIVSPAGACRADLYVRDGRIAAIGQITNATEQAGIRIIEARGCYVMPGGVDAHVHLEFPNRGSVTTDDFFTGTVAAAVGGTTTVIDMLPPPPDGANSLLASVEDWHKKAETQAVVDYCFHQIINRVDSSILQQVKTLINNGHPSVKAFLGTPNAVPDEGLLRLMEAIGACGGQLLVSAGNVAVEEFCAEKLRLQGKNNVHHYHLSRPETGEIEGTSRAVSLASLVGIPLYLVHVSCLGALEEVERGRDRGVTVNAETCPQYLLLAQDSYLLPDDNGLKYTVNPPLRDASNHRHLWKALREGAIQVVASDHCPFNYRGQKDAGREDLAGIPNGLPGVETRLTLMYNEGVRSGRLSINRFVELVAANPAKAFGLYPRKGSLMVGSDADIVILNPFTAGTISVQHLHQNVDYTPYEGYHFQGAPRLTISRGQVIVENGEFVGKAGYGRFLTRSRSPFKASGSDFNFAEKSPASAASGLRPA